MAEVKRKLIEVAVPLEAINAACKADKDRKTGTIRNLHKWFAPMPTPAWRALLFAALVDDPGDEAERARLWRLIEELVATGPVPPSKRVLERAKVEIRRSNPNGVPLVVDPFAGGGSTLIEAQRLGLSTFGSDLNPVAVLITRTLSELLPQIADAAPVAAENGRMTEGSAFESFAADVRHYGDLVREEVLVEIGEHFPTPSGGGETLAWLWTRTLTCPNPACGIETPLATSWWLSKKKGAEAWIEPRIADGRVTYDVREGRGSPTPAPKVGRGANFVCTACGTTIDEAHVQSEGREGRIGLRLTSVVEQQGRTRRYLGGSRRAEEAASAVPAIDEAPNLELPDNPRWFSPPLFGFAGQSDLYTPRQLLAVDAFTRAVSKVRDRVVEDGGDETYATAVATFLGLCVGKLAQGLSTQVRWRTRDAAAKPEAAFGRHDLPMTWDFAEANPFGGGVGDWNQIVTTALRALPFAVPHGRGTTTQRDARTVATELPAGSALVATDPPYFGHIGYADLSDYFYVWLRRALRDVHTDLFSTMAAPREGELIALPNRHDGDRRSASDYFVEGFTEAFSNLRAVQRPDLPMLVVYAHREEDDVQAVGGWEAMLDAVLRAGYTIVATLPLRGTGAQRMIGLGTNALATYVVMVCRPREIEAPRTTRRDLDRRLRTELRGSVAELQRAAIAPVDLAQAVIGPGMAIFSRYSAVLEADGRSMSVGEALRLINRTLGEILDEQETDLDAESRWAAPWFEQHGYEAAEFGEADALARAKGTAVDSLWRAGVVDRGSAKVRLRRRDELPADWDPANDDRPTVWEAVQHLVRALEEGGEQAAGELWGRLGSLADPTRELAYRLFKIAEQRKMTEEAVALNALVSALPEISRLAESRTGEQVAIF
jgi:putative DNA methylase